MRRIFKRSRIIGRRFRLVHVMQGNERVEVSTFRANHPIIDANDVNEHPDSPVDLDLVDSAADEHGRILRDNVFGTRKDDAARRDFTINALFYDPSNDEILDYHAGVKDIKDRVLRMIGDPLTRYREDPVRMLRAVRLSAKLGFAIAPETRSPIRELVPLLEHMPPSRLFDEIQKLLFSGEAVACIRKLREEGVHQGLLPMLDPIFEDQHSEKFVMHALANTDQRLRENKPVSTSFTLLRFFGP